MQVPVGYLICVYYKTTAFSYALLLPDKETKQTRSNGKAKQTANTKSANGVVCFTFLMKLKVYVCTKMSKQLKQMFFADSLGLKRKKLELQSFSWGYIFTDTSLKISFAILFISQVFKMPQAFPRGVKVTSMKKVEIKAP